MSKKHTKRIGRFDKETYNNNRQAVLALTEAKMSQKAIADVLKLSTGTIWCMAKMDWPEYCEWRDQKYAKRKAVEAAQAHGKIVDFIAESAKEGVWVTAPPDVKDATQVVAERLTNIENELVEIKDMISKRRFF
jgi:hypothetical protein